jgi:tetratricopeptide (TPR) repeat protein
MNGRRHQSIFLGLRFRALGLLAMATLLAGAGCGGETPTLANETDEPLYREGQQLKKEGRTQEALADYLKLIARRGDQAPESHFDAGLIYLEDVKDPIAAIYHFRKYLELDPNSPHATGVRDLIDTATREFARTLPGRPVDSQGGGDLLAQVDQLQRENEELKTELAADRAGGAALPTVRAAADADNAPGSLFVVPAAPAPDSTSAAVLTPADETVPSPPPPPAPAPAPRPAAAAVRHHAVVKGDTFYSLAQKYYGNRAKWRQIRDANRDQLPSDSSPLRIGMDLKIP